MTTLLFAACPKAAARQDGFRDWDELREFWRVEHPSVTDFDGLVIKWKGNVDGEQAHEEAKPKRRRARSAAER